MRFWPSLLIAAAATLAPPVSAQEVAPTTVFVVRHAEKEPTGSDPSLTAAGRTRAEALAHLLSSADVAAVYVTEFKRTQETAAPLARRLGRPAIRLEARDVGELMRRLVALPAGSRAVVVSHSNLVPAIVKQLSGVDIGELTDADYDRVYVVTVYPSGVGQAVLLRYGAPAGR